MIKSVSTSEPKSKLSWISSFIIISILIKLDSSQENHPEVRVYFEPEGLGVCSFALSWDDDSDESWDKAEKAFNEMGEKKARQAVEKIMKGLK